MRRPAPLCLLAGAALVGGWACGAPDDRDVPTRLMRIESPPLLQVGSPLRVSGVGLAGRVLVLQGAGVEVRARVDSALVEGSIVAAGIGAGLVPDAAPPVSRAARIETIAGGGSAGAALQRACVFSEASGGDGQGPCVGLIGTRTGALPALSAPTLGSGGVAAAGSTVTLTLGGAFSLVADGLLLPGEGACWLELGPLPGAVALPAPLTATLTAVDWDRRAAQARFGAAWNAPPPAGTLMRGRIWRQLLGSAVEAGPWSEPFALTLHEAPLVASCPQHGCEVRRARTLGLTTAACKDGALVRMRGQWRLQDLVVADWTADGATLPLMRGEAGSCRAGLPSDLALGQPWQGVPRGARFVGEARLVGVGEAASAPVSIVLRRGSDRQALVVRWDAGVALGFGHFGLGHHQAAVRARVVGLVSEHFANVALDVLAESPADAIEWLQVGVYGEDPNGFGLLGLDPSAGKDAGNRFRGERLDGFDAEAFSAGRGAFGGVFLSAFMRFSPTLWPGGTGVETAFDGLFGPFAPALGGTSAPPLQVGAATPGGLAAALEALAQLLAGTISHEAGHALGLAAGTDGYHHPTDNPRWRMDVGSARPFHERAALDGLGEIWGPTDAAALLAALPP